MRSVEQPTIEWQKCKQASSYFDDIHLQFRNAPVSTMGSCKIQGHQLPLTHTRCDVSAAGSEISYTVSVYSHYYHYAKEVVRSHIHQPILLCLVLLFVEMLGVLFRTLHLDCCILVNNFLLSTNLWPSIDWREEEVASITHQLTSQRMCGDRRCAVVWRSVDHVRNTKLISHMKSYGYLFVPARVINYVDPWDASIIKRNAFKTDCKHFWQQVGVDVLSLLRAQQKEVDGDSGKGGRSSSAGSGGGSTDASTLAPYEMVRFGCGGRMGGASSCELSDAEAQRVVALYEQLYLGKYSRLNPQITPAWVKQHLRSGFLTVVLLRQRVLPHRIDGVVGYWSRGGVMTAPLFGYELSERWLYRVLSLVVVLEARFPLRGLHAQPAEAEAAAVAQPAAAAVAAEATAAAAATAARGEGVTDTADTRSPSRDASQRRDTRMDADVGPDSRSDYDRTMDAGAMPAPRIPQTHYEGAIRLVNASGGASQFKRQRGARTTVELSAVYVRHLPWWRRVPWALMARLGGGLRIDKMAK